MNTSITIYAVNAHGGRSVAVEVDGLRILVESRGPEQDEAAKEAARAIECRYKATEVSEYERQEYRARVVNMSERVNRAEARTERVRSALCAALAGRRRFFGEVLVVPHEGGHSGPPDWSGPVWLLDPDKGFSGHGLRFESMADLRETHPELWPVRIGHARGDTSCEGIIMDVCALPAAARAAADATAELTKDADFEQFFRPVRDAFYTGIHRAGRGGETVNVEVPMAVAKQFVRFDLAQLPEAP